MADDFKVLAGRVQWEPKLRTAGGKQVRGVTVKTIGPAQALVTLTVWPEHAGTEVKQGDFLFAEGKFASKIIDKADGSQETVYDLSVTDWAVIPAAGKAEREVVNRPAQAASSDVPF